MPFSHTGYAKRVIALLSALLIASPATPDLHLVSKSARAIVSPKIGRLIYFGPLNGPNLLWLDRSAADGPWRNWGGDKLWTAPQSDWNWPPVLQHDGQPHHASLNDNTIHLLSDPDARGVRFVREFRLNGQELTIVNRMENFGHDPVRAAIWQITQIPGPSEIRFAYEPSALFPAGWEAYPWTTQGATRMYRDDNEIAISPNFATAQKYGMATKAGYLRAKIGNFWLRLTHPYNPQATYADNGKAQQVFLSNSPRYAELEVTAPLATIPSRGHQSMTTTLSFERAH